MKNNSNKIIIGLLVVVIIILAYVAFSRNAQAPENGENNVAITPPVNEIMPKDGVLGNKDDLISFSTWPGSKVSGILSYRGVLQGGYFFEGNVVVKILDANKNVLKTSNAVAKSDWMSSGPVNFEGNIDFTGLAKGLGFIEIHNDNPSGLPQNDKSILIPVVIQ